VKILDVDDATVHDVTFDLLDSHGVAIVPCDTIYGIVGKAPETERRIRDIKGRSSDKPYIRLIGSRDITAYSGLKIPDEILRLWPGPLTLIVPTYSGGTVALRMPDSPFLLRLLGRLDKPLYSTSVNREGRPYSRSVDTIVAEFGDLVDLLVTAGDLPEAVPSTILDLARTPYSVLRSGAVRIPDSFLS